ncbi:MAG: hypothetical protein WAL75_21525 [Terracidiphilus sp.]
MKPVCKELSRFQVTGIADAVPFKLAGMIRGLEEAESDFFAGRK